MREKVIWWLSVDNYMIQRSVRYLNKIFAVWNRVDCGSEKIIRNRISHKAELTDIVLPDYHLYQSYYAKYFLEKIISTTKHIYLIISTTFSGAKYRLLW